MRSMIFAAVLLAASPALASGPLAALTGALVPGLALGTTCDSVRSALADIGWELREMPPEAGLLEACAVQRSLMAEITIAPVGGEIVPIAGND